MPAPSTVCSFAKVNLGLRIGPPRPDGYHDLSTLYQTIALHDEVTVEAEVASVTSITLSSNDPRLPTDSRNTVHRMVSAALDTMGVAASVRVRLQKNLPVQGGLGAGSANAAAALLGLLRQLAPVGTLTGAQQLALAERIGSDVPLFLIGGTVYGHDRGQRVQPYPDLPAMPCVIVAPGVGSSTPQAFRAWDAHVASLSPAATQSRLEELCRLYAAAAVAGGRGVGNSQSPDDLGGPFSADRAADSLSALVGAGLNNDFESVVFEQHPFLRDSKRALTGEGSVPAEQQAILAMLSGSGSSLFGLYRTWDDAKAAQARAQPLRGLALLTETLPRAAYWRALFAQQGS